MFISAVVVYSKGWGKKQNFSNSVTFREKKEQGMYCIYTMFAYNDDGI